MKLVSCITLVCCLSHLNAINTYYRWLTIDAAQSFIEELTIQEQIKSSQTFRGNDRRNSSPIITGDGFRSMALPHLCDETNRCRFDPDKMTPGACVFVKSDLFSFFGSDVVQRIKVPYILISHNGDVSTPDGQNDARIGLAIYNTTTNLQNEYESGRLLAHHGQNLWWLNPKENKKPNYSHCIPIGVENRYNWFGSNISVYIEAMKRYVSLVKEEEVSIKTAADQLPPRPLLLVAFHQKRQVPDRTKALSALKVAGKIDMFFNHTGLRHHDWLYGIMHHRFVLAPHGHGLDTHRMMEIFLMGGIPVVRKSTITSCYDDSDNQVNEAHPRGSLPIVIVDRYEDLNRSFLESEWTRISSNPSNHWDWKRLHMSHWIERIGCNSYKGDGIYPFVGRSLE